MKAWQSTNGVAPSNARRHLGIVVCSTRENSTVRGENDGVFLSCANLNGNVLVCGAKRLHLKRPVNLKRHATLPDTQDTIQNQVIYIRQSPESLSKATVLACWRWAPRSHFPGPVGRPSLFPTHTTLLNNNNNNDKISLQNLLKKYYEKIVKNDMSFALLERNVRLSSRIEWTFSLLLT